MSVTRSKVSLTLEGREGSIMMCRVKRVSRCRTWLESELVEGGSSG